MKLFFRISIGTYLPNNKFNISKNKLSENIVKENTFENRAVTTKTSKLTIPSLKIQ